MRSRRIRLQKPGLATDEAHVWQIALDVDTGQLPALVAVLSADERAQASRYHFRRDRDHFVAARGALRTLLASYLDMPAHEVRFAYGPQGKPLLPDTDLRFNLAHSGNLALCAVTRGREVGIDLEQDRVGIDVETLAGHFFAPAEVRALLALPPPLRRSAFLACWTRKEAYVKALGGGLSISLDSFTVSLTPSEPAAILAPADKAVGWSLTSISPGPGYVACVAVEGQGCRLRYYPWQP